MVDWKPINTAPKDGTEILVAYTLKFNGKTKLGVSNAFWFEGGEGIDEKYKPGWVNYLYQEEITYMAEYIESDCISIDYWQPMPKHPEEAQGDE